MNQELRRFTAAVLVLSIVSAAIAVGVVLFAPTDEWGRIGWAGLGFSNARDGWKAWWELRAAEGRTR